MVFKPTLETATFRAGEKVLVSVYYSGEFLKRTKK
jgi:hypothetical protein